MNNNTLSGLLGKRVYRTERNSAFSKYIKVYFDQERYLSDYCNVTLVELTSRHAMVDMSEFSIQEHEVDEAEELKLGDLVSRDMGFTDDSLFLQIENELLGFTMSVSLTAPNNYSTGDLRNCIDYEECHKLIRRAIKESNKSEHSLIDLIQKYLKKYFK